MSSTSFMARQRSSSTAAGIDRPPATPVRRASSSSTSMDASRSASLTMKRGLPLDIGQYPQAGAVAWKLQQGKSKVATGQVAARASIIVRSSGALRSTGTLLSKAEDTSPQQSPSPQPPVPAVHLPLPSEAKADESSGSSVETTASSSSSRGEDATLSFYRELSSFSRPKSRKAKIAASPPRREIASREAEDASAEQTLASDVANGLTPASLKHLRRQCEGLSEERVRLLAEIARLRALLDRSTATPETAAKSACDEDTMDLEGLRDEAGRAYALAAAESARSAELRARAAELEDEVARLKKALEDQRVEMERKLADHASQAETARAAAEAAFAAAEAAWKERAEEREQLVARLRKQVLELESEQESWRRRAHDAEAALKVTSTEYADFKKRYEAMKVKLVADSVKMQLHVCIPETTLVFDEDTSTRIGLSVALTRDRLGDFVKNDVFPHVKPLWLCLDGMDRAPDGTSEKKYSDKLLGMFASAIEDFVYNARQSKHLR
eukprot:TRINITY_DN19969_c0_g1_i1.p1 TRINITY_DN19969_c0_g1~~TRINITY_DN19969_c0_g1_i1.p1  ORF type:complete len:524 (+),score=128.69 TRINITY_DN19969_c0_g1_i1:77-1573(+)